MDASQSALDSLRTVEFRETLKGYHRDDVDEYLEKAAVEAEGLQEQLRQNGERLRQAAERISQLEAELERKPEPEPERVEPAVPDDTLQRTLLLAQKFVDETKADSEAQAARIIAEADAKTRLLTDDAPALPPRIRRFRCSRPNPPWGPVGSLPRLPTWSLGCLVPVIAPVWSLGHAAGIWIAARRPAR